MRIIVLLLLSVFSLLFAKTRCYDFDDYADYSNDLVKIKKYIEKNAEQKEHDNCILEGGPGSVFHMGVSIYRTTECGSGSNYKSGSVNGYLEINFACNKCEGKKLKDELNRIEAKCNDACMSSIAYCQKPDMYNSTWGGYIENGEVCGETLPECQSEDSSSSQNEESSSSEELSSSSEEGEIDSSSSDDDVDESSSSGGESGCGEGGDHCTPNPFGYKEGYTFVLLR